MAAKVGAVNYFLSPLVINLRIFYDYVLTNPQFSTSTCPLMHIS